MEIQFSIAAVLIALAGIHILEESVKGFRSFFNTSWFNGNENCPVSRMKGLWVDKIGLFLILAVSAIAGAKTDGRWILIALGIITADLLQHSLFSISKRSYTPGVATSLLYLIYVAYFFAQEELRFSADDLLAWLAMAGGAAVIGFNYVTAWARVRQGRCKPL